MCTPLRTIRTRRNWTYGSRNGSLSQIGLKKSSTLTKGLYLLILCGTAYLNVTAWQQLPTQIDLRTWFGFSSVTVPSAAYCIVTFLVIVYLVYRDIVNRSLSRRKLFIPLIFYMGNYFMIEYLLESLVA